MLAFAGITGRPGTEADFASGGPRVDAENFVVGLAGRGVRSSVVRLPPIVHSSLDHHGFAHILIDIARQSGVSGYVADGANRWPSVHTLDAARVYRLALEGAPAGSRLHAVADEGIPFRDIAAAIGRGAGVPVASVSASRRRRAVRLPRRVRGGGQPDLKRGDAEGARLGAGASRAHRGPGRTGTTSAQG